MDYPKPDSMVEGYDYSGPITFDKHGWLASGQFPAQCIAECSGPGSVDSAVEYWVNRLHFDPPRDLAIRYLREYGAWDDLDTADSDTLAQRVLWTACCDIAEQGEWLGLIH